MTLTPAKAPVVSLPKAARRAPIGEKNSATKKLRIPSTDAASDQSLVELAAAVLSVREDEPVVEVLQTLDHDLERLPSALFRGGVGQTLEEVLRMPVEQVTGRSIGYLQQLIAFLAFDPERVLIGYLALVHDRGRRGRETAAKDVLRRESRWQGCYGFLPWEDWRVGRPQLIDDTIIPALTAWARVGSEPRKTTMSRAARGRLRAERATRSRLAFGSPGKDWDEEKVLTRFDLMVEAKLIAEENGSALAVEHPVQSRLGRVMVPGHRRILAAALGRLRSDLKMRPVVFELMDDEFSLYDLQRTVEIILGPHLHKQNFRRLIETANLVEPTGGIKSHTGGRPAKLYRFRRDLLLERPKPQGQ